jgi:hypothetical protein
MVEDEHHESLTWTIENGGTSASPAARHATKFLTGLPNHAVDEPLQRLAEVLELAHGIPAHDTFGRVFARFDPAQVEAGFLRWVQTVARTAAPEVIALDGKTVRGSGDRRTGLGPLHLISQVVTIDAIGCQTEIVAQIIDGGADYVLALKANQPDLLADVVDSFTLATTMDDTVRTVEKHHGRLEVRVCETIDDHRAGADHAGPLLSEQPAGGGQADRRSRAQPLGDREHPALGLGSGLPGR